MKMVLIVRGTIRRCGLGVGVALEWVWHFGVGMALLEEVSH